MNTFSIEKKNRLHKRTKVHGKILKLQQKKKKKFHDQVSGRKTSEVFGPLFIYLNIFSLLDAAKLLKFQPHRDCLSIRLCVVDNQRITTSAARGASARYPGESAQRQSSRSVASTLFIHEQINDVFIPVCCPWCHNHSGGIWRPLPTFGRTSFFHSSE